MPRPVKEWIGKTPTTPCPPRVKLRIWERQEGRCYLSGEKINPGDAKQLDHIIALVNGGENRESNLAWALTKFHKLKTDADVAEKSDVARKAKKHLGIKPVGPQPEIRSAPMPTTPKAAKRAEREPKKQVPPRFLPGFVSPLEG